MKKVFILLLLKSTLMFAGYGEFQGSYIDMYDSDTGLYYKAVSNKSEKSGFIISKSNYHISNINIFNPKNNTSKMIFTSHNQKITNVLFESGYKDNKIIFNESYDYIKNNQNIIKRPIINKILIETYNGDKKETTLWCCNKNGENLKRITTISQKYSWHIDVKNSKIRVVFSQDEQFKIKSFEW